MSGHQKIICEENGAVNPTHKFAVA